MTMTSEKAWHTMFLQALFSESRWVAMSHLQGRMSDSLEVPANQALPQALMSHKLGKKKQGVLDC